MGFEIKDNVLIKYTKESGVTDVVIPDGVTSIGDYAFYGWSSLTSIIIPDGVTSIGKEAFHLCESLTSITIPDSVTKIGGRAFDRTAYYNNKANWENDVLYIGHHLIKAEKSLSGSYIIKDDTKSIGDDAFEGCSNLTGITIPGSVTSIGKNAFYDCESLISITIPDSVTSIGRKAFDGCNSLTSITIPDSVTSIGDLTFCGCFRLTSITIPDSVTSIGKSAFSYCSSLTSITIPDSVTSIGDDAFQECKSLKSITIPDSVTDIGWHAFYWCKSLKSIIMPTKFKAYLKVFQKETIIDYIANCLGEEIELPKAIQTILKKNCKEVFKAILNSNSATALRNMLVSVNLLPIDDIDELINKASKNAEFVAILMDYKNNNYSANDIEANEEDKMEKEIGLKERTASDWKKIFKFVVKEKKQIRIQKYLGSDEEFEIPSEIDGIPVTELSTTFSDSIYTVKKLIIPSTVKEIPNSAFFYCSSLKSITIPDSVTSIGKNAFHLCESLTSITIPDSVTSIGRMAFCGCSSLTSITIPDGVTSIGESAFYDCSSLTSITIPDSVTSIGDDAFYGCGQITIFAPKGSKAEKYAAKNNIKFKLI